MKVTYRNARKEIPFGELPVSGGFIYNNQVCMKITLPDNTPATVVVETGESFCIKHTTFVYPIELEVICS